MRAWGYESFANDTTMNIICIYCEDEKLVRQEQADKCLKNEFNEETCELSLGLVIWFIQKGLKVDELYLQKALRMAQKEQADEKLYVWADPKARNDMLEEEIKLLNTAIESGGYYPPSFEKHLQDILQHGMSVCEKVRTQARPRKTMVPYSDMPL
jgi:hypothetical protein